MLWVLGFMKMEVFLRYILFRSMTCLVILMVVLFSGITVLRSDRFIVPLLYCTVFVFYCPVVLVLCCLTVICFAHKEPIMIHALHIYIYP